MWPILLVVLAVVVGYFILKKGCPLCGPKKDEKSDVKKGGSCCS